MYRKVGSFAKQVSYPIIAFTLYGFVLALVLPRQIGLTFRYDFSIVIPFIYLLLGLSFYFSGYKGRLIALSVTLIIFALPLSGLWNSGNSERYLIGGLFPFSDAYHYYMDAKRLLIQQPFSDFTARRPLFSAMLAVILFVTKQNLQVTLALLVLITACSSYIATREIQKEFGTIPAVLFLSLIHI